MKEIIFESKFLYEQFKVGAGGGNIGEMFQLINYDWDKIHNVSLINDKGLVKMVIQLKTEFLAPSKKIELLNGDILVHYNDNYQKIDMDTIEKFKSMNKIIQDENENR